MGGFGSGSWYRTGTKPTEANFRRLSIKQVGLSERKKAMGILRWSAEGEVLSSVACQINTLETPFWIRVCYSIQGTGEKFDYKIPLVTTQPNYRGIRWWFACPTRGCGRRTGVLYLTGLFACRSCCNLVYASQNTTPHFRALNRAQKIHRQLGGDGIVDDVPPKPKGMHWVTYWKKIVKMQNAHEHCWKLTATEMKWLNMENCEVFGG